MKISFFAFAVLLACVCTISYADNTLDFLNSFTGSSVSIGDTLSGLFSAAGSYMVNADVVLNCGLAAISDKLKSNAKDLLIDVSSCDPSKSDEIENKLQSLLISLPQSINQCVQNAPDTQSFLVGFYFANVAQDLIKSKITNHIRSNPLSACLDLQELQSYIRHESWDLFKSGAQDFIVEMFSTSENEVGANRDHFTQMLVGLTSKVKTPINVKSLISCGSESTFKSTEPLLLSIIDEAALCDVTKLNDILSKMIYLVTSVPAAEAQCVSKNPETKKLMSGFGISGLTPEEIRAKVTKYFTSHSLLICNMFDGLNKKLKNSDFKGFGADVGKMMLEIFKNSNQEEDLQDVILELLGINRLESKSMDTVAEVLGGLASVTSAKGADVKTTVKCTDEATSKKFLSTLSDLISQASDCDLTKMAGIISEVYALINDFPESQQPCFKKDPAANQIFSALGIYDLTLDKLVAKVVAYAISHFSDSCNTVKALNRDITNANWKQLGADSGTLLLAIFKGH
jgi:hypothetical protein